MASSLKGKVSRWLTREYYSTREACSRRRAFKLFYLIPPPLALFFGTRLLLRYYAEPYRALWVYLWMASNALYLAFSILGCYTKLEERRLAPAVSLLWLLGTVLFLLGSVVMVLTR